MAKAKVISKISAINQDEIVTTSKAIVKNNIITFKDGDVMINVKILNEGIIIERCSDEIKLSLFFEENAKKTGKYYINSLGLDIIVDTYTNVLKIDDDSIIIEYDLYLNGELSDKFKYELRWSV